MFNGPNMARRTYSAVGLIDTDVMGNQAARCHPELALPSDRSDDAKGIVIHPNEIRGVALGCRSRLGHRSREARVRSWSILEQLRLRDAGAHPSAMRFIKSPRKGGGQSSGGKDRPPANPAWGQRAEPPSNRQSRPYPRSQLASEKQHEYE